MILKKRVVFALVIIGSMSAANLSMAQTAKKPIPKASKPITKVIKINPSPVSGLALKNSKDSLSYAIGVNIGENFKSQKLDVNPDVLAKAIRETTAGTNGMTSQQCAAYIQNYFASKNNNPNDKSGIENKKKGDEFLAKNKTLPGVNATASGLQYKVVNEGAGPKPTPSDKVKVHYHGTLIDGTVFDSSVNRGEPAEFGVTQVIQGWVEALQLMPMGSKWTLYIPSNLAYGAQGPPGIGSNQVLIFDVELLDIIK